MNACTWRIENYYIAAVLVVAGVVLLMNLVDSRVGRALRSIHGSEEAANAMGVDTSRYKLLVFVLSAVFASVAGVFLTHFNGGIGSLKSAAEARATTTKVRLATRLENPRLKREITTSQRSEPITEQSNPAMTGQAALPDAAAQPARDDAQTMNNGAAQSREGSALGAPKAPAS